MIYLTLFCSNTFSWGADVWTMQSRSTLLLVCERTECETGTETLRRRRMWSRDLVSLLRSDEASDFLLTAATLLALHLLLCSTHTLSLSLCRPNVGKMVVTTEAPLWVTAALWMMLIITSGSGRVSNRQFVNFVERVNSMPGLNSNNFLF